MIVRVTQPAPPHREQPSESDYDLAEVWYLVKLDLEAVRQHLSKADRTAYTLEYVTQWLSDSGFHPKDASWLVRGAELGQVEPDEVLSIEEWRGPTPK